MCGLVIFFRAGKSYIYYYRVWLLFFHYIFVEFPLKDVYYPEKTFKKMKIVAKNPIFVCFQGPHSFVYIFKALDKV